MSRTRGGSGGKNIPKFHPRNRREHCDSKAVRVPHSMPNSEKSPRRDSSREKPKLHERVRLFFADNRRAAGRWTGLGWFSEGREVQPVAWQYFEPPAGLR
jgi:hypothetical protein